ncbi:hypothetical protein Q9L58_008319 [Maublancomyces gigas]|uniref:Uncharacterized protein n=1 Tax=Discina gigas TaxID=1032678 RepID=A0ABR3GA20_9PEZI
MGKSIKTPVTIVVRRSQTDKGPLPWNHPYRAAGLFITTKLQSHSPTPLALLSTVLSLLPSGRRIIDLHPAAADPAWWQVATSTGTRELADWSPQAWKEFSANKGKNGLKLFLLPSIPLELLLPSPSKSIGPPLVPPNPVASVVAPPSPVAHTLHPRITEALKHAQYYPTEEIIQRIGRESLHVAVSHYLGNPTTILVLAPIFSLLLTECSRSETGPSSIIVTPTYAHALHVVGHIRTFLRWTMAYTGIILGDSGVLLGISGPEAVVAVVPVSEITGRLHSPQVVLLGNMDIECEPGVVVTRVTGTRTGGWQLSDTATNQAEVYSAIATSGMANGVLAACRSLSEGMVVVLGNQDLADELADVEGVEVMRQGGVLPVEIVRILLCMELGVLEGLCVPVVAGIVAVQESQDVLELFAEMVGEKGMLILLA